MTQLATKVSSVSPKGGENDFGSTLALACDSGVVAVAKTVEAVKATASGTFHGSKTEEAGDTKKKLSCSIANVADTNAQPLVLPKNATAAIIQPIVPLPILATPGKIAVGEESYAGDTSKDAVAAVNLPMTSGLQDGLNVGVAQEGPGGLTTANSTGVAPASVTSVSVVAQAPLPATASAPVAAAAKVAVELRMPSPLELKESASTAKADSKAVLPVPAAVQSRPPMPDSVADSTKATDIGKQRVPTEVTQSPERVTAAPKPDAASSGKDDLKKPSDPQLVGLVDSGNTPLPTATVLPADALAGANGVGLNLAGSNAAHLSSAGSNVNGLAQQTGGVQPTVAAKSKGSSFDAGMKSNDETNSGVSAKGTDAVAPIHASQNLFTADRDASAPMSTAAGQASQQVSPTGAAPVQSQTGQLAGSSQPASPTPATAAVSAAAPVPVTQTDVHAMSSVSNAQLIQSAQHSEMRVGMQSAEFGNISINTSLNHQALSAQISTEHLELGRALAVHMPAIEEKLSSAYGVQARVEVRDGGNSGSSSSYSSSGQQSNENRQSRGASASNAGSAAANPMMPLVGSSTSSIVAESSRLDIRV
jgi:hypothetical protein